MRLREPLPVTWSLAQNTAVTSHFFQPHPLPFPRLNINRNIDAFGGDRKGKRMTMASIYSLGSPAYDMLFHLVYRVSSNF